MPDLAPAVLQNRIYAAFRGRCIDGRFRPGQRLNIAALAKELGISPTPVREALTRLAGRDMAYELRGEGFYLTRLVAPDIAGLYEVHGYCVARMIKLGFGANWPSEPITEIWEVFREIGVLTAHTMLADVESYVVDRLSFTRRAEMRIMPALDEITRALGVALQDTQIQVAVQLAAQFHRTMVAKSREISDIINR